MRLLIHEEFTGIGVQKFHMEDQESRSFIWKMCLLIYGVYWYQEPKSSIWKMRLLIHGKLLSTFTLVKMCLLIPSEFVYSY